jgi:glycosyltransferase involved in cell wall biosynthesis
MRLLLLAPSLETGGAERQLVVLANGLGQRGHHVAVGLFNARGALLEHLNSDVSVLDLGKKGRSDFFWFLFRLRQALRQERPDVIYSFLGVPNLSTLFLKILGPSLPTIWGVRASDMDMSRYDWLARICCVLEARLSRFADRIVVNSNAGKQHAVKRGVPAAAMSVVYNGIDTERLRPDKASGFSLRRQWCPTHGALLVGIVARLDPMKDHQTFLRAAKLALQKNLDLHFVCIGDGPLGDQLKEFGERIGLSRNLTWAGFRPDMPAVYNALDMLCLSSITEGFPNVLGEAMSCSVPCITTDVGDAAHEIGDTGLVVPKGNPEAMAKAILKMAERVRNGDAPDPRSRIKGLFSLERMVVETERILFEVA